MGTKKTRAVRAIACVASLWLVTWTGEAAAEELDLFSARARYGVSVRNGGQTDSGPGVSYGGVTPNDLALSGYGYFALDRKLGAHLSLQREAFSLFDGPSRVTDTGLLRVAVGPVGRYKFGPVTLEALAGYGFAQLAAFDRSDSAKLKPASRHAVLLAARGLVDVGPVTVEAKFELPIAVASSFGDGTAGSTSGFVVGGGARIQLVRVGAMEWGALLEASYTRDEGASTGGTRFNQALVRVGGAIDLRWKEADPLKEIEKPIEVKDLPPLATTGTLVAQVSDLQKAPVEGAEVSVGVLTAKTNAQGQARFVAVSPGPVAVKVTRLGFQAAEETASVEAGATATVEVQLLAEKQRVLATIKGLVRSTADGKPVAATLEIPEAKLRVVADEKGAFSVQLPAGTYTVTISAPRFITQTKSVSVKDGDQAIFNVDLYPR